MLGAARGVARARRRRLRRPLEYQVVLASQAHLGVVVIRSTSCLSVCLSVASSAVVDISRTLPDLPETALW